MCCFMVIVNKHNKFLCLSIDLILKFDHLMFAKPWILSKQK